MTCIMWKLLLMTEPWMTRLAMLKMGLATKGLQNMEKTFNLDKTRVNCRQIRIFQTRKMLWYKNNFYSLNILIYTFKFSVWFSQIHLIFCHMDIVISFIITWATLEACSMLRWTNYNVVIRNLNNYQRMKKKCMSFKGETRFLFFFEHFQIKSQWLKSIEMKMVSVAFSLFFYLWWPLK